MKATEAAALLTIAAAYDNRKPDADQAKAWAMVLDGLRFEDCREVIVAHFRKSRDWMMPADVIAGVKRLRAKRLHDHDPVTPPSHIDPDDTAALIRWQRETDQAIADGTYRAEATDPLQVEGRRDVIRELGQANSVEAALATKPLRQAHAEARAALQAAEADRIAERDARQARLEEMRAADRAAREAPAPTIAEPKRLDDPHEQRDPKVQAARDEIGVRETDSNQEMSA